jgi:uncharacterized protein (DUF885 family)
MKYALLSTALLLAGCSANKSPAEFDTLTSDFVYSSLALSPVSATAAGYHKHDGRELDSLLDDMSAAGLDKQRAHYRAFDGRLNSLDPARLDPQSRADLGLIRAQIALGLLDLDEVQSWRHNPTVYVETIGNAIFTPFSVEYAPAADRFRHIRQRLEQVPAFVANAKANLADTPEIWARVAIEENDGSIALIDKAIRAAVPADQQAAYTPAADNALKALREFNEFIRKLPSTGPDGWRAGKDIYAKKFRLSMGSDRSPEQALAAAEASLTEIRREMFKLALPLHQKFYPKHRDPVDLNLIVNETLAKIADQHPTRQGYFEAAQKTLDESRAFVKSKDFLAMPQNDNLKIIPTPGFMRGIYGVGGFSPAPSLEPNLQAYYWLTPIPDDWSKERAESKLREYNLYGLQMLTIHEAIPGHYVQYEFAGRVQPGPRRLLRSVFGSGVYVEGWAMYAMEQMCDEGYMNGSPELRLTLYKHFLRSIANAIMDIRFHTQGLKDEEAMELMLKRTFQEREEAIAKLQRAKLAVCQLPTYWVGYQEWKRLRADWKGTTREFNERALAAGALPMNELRGVLIAPAPPSKESSTRP